MTNQPNQLRRFYKGFEVNWQGETIYALYCREGKWEVTWNALETFADVAYRMRLSDSVEWVEEEDTYEQV